MKEPRELTIREAGELIWAGKLTAERLLESCLERIHAREGVVHAWAEVYEKEALAEARRCDRELQAGSRRGPLHGIPVGVKDIIDVKGQWTRCGTPVYPARIPVEDAPVIARLRKAGAIFLGKTETTPFANNDPTITRNPWNPEHTPGGSSSGSGAAVADRMCLFALGTQTGGSLLRPAAYNGIVGFKATYGEVSNEGVLPNSWSLDHVGAHTRSVADAAILWPCVREAEPRPFARMPEPPLSSRSRPPDSPPRLGTIREFFEADTSPEVLENLAAVRERFLQAGAEVVELTLPHSFAFVGACWSIIKQAELYAYHRPLFEAHRDDYPPKLRTRLEKGNMISGHEYVEHQRRRITFQREMSARMADVDALIMPIASTTAPRGLASTGSSIFNQPWSVSGFPAVSIPTGLDQNGLPFGMQIAAQPYAEDTLLDVAAWCEKVLAFTASPEDRALGFAKI
jgi:Asp-tRNA(Asn)/Glu-tRNA(Gln) amidotransferase A subunit family amidase